MHVVSDKTPATRYLFVILLALLLCLFFALWVLCCFITLSYAEWRQRQHGQGINALHADLT